MKNKIKEALKTEYKNLGFGEKAFDGVTEYLATSIKEESEIEAGIKGLAPLLKAMQSETDKVRTEKTALEKKIQEAEEAAKAAAGKQEKKEPETKGAGDETPEWAKALIESNKVLTTKLAAIEGEKVVTSRKSQLQKAIENAPDALKTRYEKDLDRMNFKDDEDYTAWLEEVKTDTEAFMTDAAAKGVVIKKPGGTAGVGDNKEKVSPEVEARVKAREAEQTAPLISGIK